VALLSLLVFDGDDTLWSTMPLYTAAKTIFVDLVSEKTGASESCVTDLLERLDRKNVKRFGFSPRRFPTSMTEAYDALTRAAGQRTDPAFRKRLYSIGTDVFNQAPHAVPGACPTLKALKARGFRLVLCTKGNNRIQSNRIDVSGLRDLFDGVYVVADKTDAEFRKILSDFGVKPEEACSIGNSVRSDINPALRVGMNAVLVPRDTWSYERARPIRTTRLRVVSTLRRLPLALGLTSSRAEPVA
jgi:putative hydrolase of the HAD superfamily